MFIPSIDAMWCECLTFFYKIGFSSFSTRSIEAFLVEKLEKPTL